jgi:DNA-binding IclR family transcriptional regulator
MGHQSRIPVVYMAMPVLAGPSPTSPSGGSTRGPMSRWIRILEAFAEQGEWGIRDLARDTGIPRSAIHRIVHDMNTRGLLTEDGGRFAIGPDLARIGILVAAHLDSRRLGRPIMERVADELGETVVLALYDPSRRQFSAVDAVETSHPIRYIWESLREWSDLHLGSSGKGILAFLPEAEVEAILAGLPDPIGGRRPMSKQALRAELAAARRRGYVVSHGERFEGAVGVSAPIRDGTGRVVGDLIGTWPDNRTDRAKEEHAGAVVRAAADELSARLGWSGA